MDGKVLPAGGKMIEAMAVGAAAAEIAVLSLAVFAVFRSRERTDAEAAACALVLPLMFLSCLFQLAFLLGRPSAAIPFEIGAVLLGLKAVFQHKASLRHASAAMVDGVRAHRFASVFIAAAAAYLFFQAVALPAGLGSWDDLASMAFLESRRTFFPADPLGSSRLLDPLAESLNGPILFHLLLRAGTDRGIGLFGFTAYLAIGFGTYALARRYAWPPTAFTTALVVLSFPRLVVQASGPGVELLAAASALLCLMSLYRLLERPNGGDLILAGLFLLFSISGGQMSFTFPVVLAALAVVLLYRRHGGRIWWGVLLEQRGRFLAAAAAATVFSQLWRVLARGIEGQEMIAGGMAPNTGGLAGALANLVRYGLESIHLTLPLEHAGRWLFGFSPIGTLESLYGWLAAPLLGQVGAAAPFQIRWLPDGTLAWFGPFGFLLLLPAVAYTLWRGPRRIKAISLALAVYGYLVTLVPAWQPGNARHFTFFFVCGGFFIAFFLPPWRLTTIGKHVLQGLSLALIVYAGLLNTASPAVGYAGWMAAVYGPDEVIAAQSLLLGTRQGFWHRIGEDRWHSEEGKRLFGDDRLLRLSELIEPGRPLGVCFSRPERLYPLLLHRPELQIVPVSGEASPAKIRAQGIEYLLYLDTLPDRSVSGSGARLLWRPADGKALPGALFFLPGEGHVHASARFYREPARIPRQKISKPISRVGFR